MGKNHIKRIAVPKQWELPRKKTRYLVRSSPGAHALGISLPLAVVLRDVLKIAKTARDVRYIINEQEVFIDGKRRKKGDLPIGLMDVITIPKTDQCFRLVMKANGKLGVVPIEKKEQNMKVCRIVGKKKMNAKTFQFALSDGRTIKAENNSYHVGDSVQIEVPSQNVQHHFSFAEGAAAYLIGGSHLGCVGTVQRIHQNMVHIKSGSLEFQTSKNNVFVVGKEKAVVTIQ